MGKNAAHKAQQRARHTGAADEPGAADTGDGTVDASFHSPAWCDLTPERLPRLLLGFAAVLQALRARCMYCMQARSTNCGIDDGEGELGGFQKAAEGSSGYRSSCCSR